MIERDRQFAQFVAALEFDAGVELGVFESPCAVGQLPDRLAKMRRQQRRGQCHQQHADGGDPQQIPLLIEQKSDGELFIRVLRA
mgnify:CR=1 FL=1